MAALPEDLQSHQHDPENCFLGSRTERDMTGWTNVIYYAALHQVAVEKYRKDGQSVSVQVERIAVPQITRTKEEILDFARRNSAAVKEICQSPKRRETLKHEEPHLQATEGQEFTCRDDFGNTRLCVEAFVNEYESQIPGHLHSSNHLIREAQRMTGLAVEQVREDYREWIRKHLTEEDLREVPGGEPICSLMPDQRHVPEDPVFSVDPSKARFALRDCREEWEERYHPFLQAHSSDVPRSLQALREYADVPRYTAGRAVCLAGAAVSGSCREATDGIRYLHEEQDSIHDGGDWKKNSFELIAAAPSQEDLAPLQPHPGLPDCRQAFLKGDRVLLCCPFFLNGWFELYYVKESGNALSSESKTENVATG